MTRVLNDPVMRYVLADEVGLGKTIEAGLIIRQLLLDRPSANVTVCVPATLRGQWLEARNSGCRGRNHTPTPRVVQRDQIGALSTVPDLLVIERLTASSRRASVAPAGPP